jgi:hypothetical protein
MRLLIQAIITGFGLKLGSDIYKYVKAKAGFVEGPDEDAIEEAGKAGGAA